MVSARRLERRSRGHQHGRAVSRQRLGHASRTRLRAVEYFRRAADAGHAWAQYNLGHMYLDGRGIAQNPTAAFCYYLKAAEQRHERAMNLLGRCCEQGWGTPRNAAAAADWYRRSAEAGYFRGQYNWASLLREAGRIDEAVVWFERAAAGGNAIGASRCARGIAGACVRRSLRSLGPAST